METRVIKITPDNPDRSTLKAVASMLLRGEIVVLPTDTIYGFHCRADAPAAVRAIHELKGRGAPKPMVVLLPAVDYLDMMEISVPDGARVLIEKFWPGPLTLVFPAGAGVCREALAGGDTVAVRHPGHLVLHKVLGFAEVPLVSSSVNLESGEPLNDADSILRSFEGRVHGILDGGPIHHRAPSTIVSFVGDRPRVLREGAIPAVLLAPFLG